MMKQLIYSSSKNLPKIQIKVKAFEKKSIENFITNLSTYSSLLHNPFYFKNSIKKLTFEEYFNTLVFKYDNAEGTFGTINKEDLTYLLNRKKLFHDKKKEEYHYKIAKFYSIKNIAIPSRRKIFSILRSPHVFKKSQEHFEYKINKSFNILSCSNNLEKDRFFLLLKNLIFKKYSGIQMQYKIVSFNYYFQ